MTRTLLALSLLVLSLVGLGLALGQDRAGDGARAPRPEPPRPVDAQKRRATDVRQPADRGAAAGAPEPGAGVNRQADRGAIVELTNSIERAYNEHDPEPIANLFVPEGQWIDQSAASVSGRTAIAAALRQRFVEEPEARIELETDDIQFPGENVAVQRGQLVLVAGAGKRPVHDRFSAVLLRGAEGGWQIGVLYDLEGEEGEHRRYLEPLAWLIGVWVDESPGAKAELAYSWSQSGSFLVGQFSLNRAGLPWGSGEERIGWDPVQRKVRSWVFDSDGGFLEGDWYPSGERWIVKYSGVTGAGATVSSTHELVPVDSDRWTRRARDRVIGGAVQPDSEELVIVRKAPQPPEVDDE